MVRIVLTPKYVQRVKDRGVWYYYFRRPGYPRVKLPDLRVSLSEFTKAYGAAMKAESVVVTKRRAARSIGALIESYLKTADFASKRESTKMTYRNSLARLEVEYAAYPVPTMRPLEVRAMFDDRAGKPGAIKDLRRMLNILMQHAIDLDWRDDNPVANVRPIKGCSEGRHSWTEEEIAQFESHHKVASRARLAFDLFLWTGQRISNVRIMGRQHVRNGVLQ